MDRPDADPLIAGLIAGDKRAYAALYDRFGVRLYRTAYGIVRSVTVHGHHQGFGRRRAILGCRLGLAG